MRIQIVFGAIGAVPIEAVAAITAAPRSTGLLLIVLFDEALHHLGQARGARLKLYRRAITAVLVKMRLLDTDLLCGGIPENIQELAFEEPLEPRLHHRLHRLAVFRRVRIDRLDLHWERHDQRDRYHEKVLGSTSDVQFTILPSISKSFNGLPIPKSLTPTTHRSSSDLRLRFQNLRTKELIIWPKMKALFLNQNSRRLS